MYKVYILTHIDGHIQTPEVGLLCNEFLLVWNSISIFIASLVLLDGRVPKMGTFCVHVTLFADVHISFFIFAIIYYALVIPR